MSQFDKSALLFVCVLNINDNRILYDTVLDGRRSIRIVHKMTATGGCFSMLIDRLFARKTQEEDCGYYRRCILGLVTEWRGCSEWRIKGL